jgi:hypothetical protein
MLSSHLREELRQRFCLKERLGGFPFHLAKFALPTLDIDDHILPEFVVADVPDYPAARHLNALQGLKRKWQRAFQARGLAMGLANCEEPAQPDGARGPHDPIPARNIRSPAYHPAGISPPISIAASQRSARISPGPQLSVVPRTRPGAPCL